MPWIKPLIWSLGIGGSVSLAVYALMDARDEQKDDGIGSKKKKKEEKVDSCDANLMGAPILDGTSNDKKNSAYMKSLRQAAQDRSDKRTNRIIPTGAWRGK